MEQTGTGAPSPTPAPLVGVIREGFSVFLALQATRYRQPDDATPPMPAVMMTKAAGGRRSAPADLSPAEWCEAYRQCLRPLNDDATDGICGLVTTVLQILADGGAHTVGASGAVCAWYRAFRLDEVFVEEKRLELSALDLDGHSDHDVGQIGIFFLDTIERCFFAGAFGAAAALIETLMAALRTGARVNPFSRDVESCITGIKRLLVASYTDEHSFAAWRQDANDQIFDAKRVLSEGSQVTTRDPAAVQVAGSLCTVCLGILLAISGDVLQVRQRCLEADLSLLDYLVALCAIAVPFKSLAELWEVLATAAPVWAGKAESQWQSDIALQLFAAESLADVVRAMGAVADVAADCFPWQPEELDGDGVDDNDNDNDDDDDDDDDDDEDDGEGEEIVLSAPVDGECEYAFVRHFSLVFLAAHLADVCAPAVTAPSHDMALTFARNDLCADYVRLFADDGMLWRAAATYQAYSPFADPALLYNTVTGAARAAATDGALYLSLCSFFRTMLDAGSAHQRLMRSLLRQRLGEHPTLVQWLTAFDHYTREAFTDSHRYAIATRLNAGDAAMAAWLAVEAQLPSPLQSEVRRTLRGPAALSDECVYRIGEAAHNSFLALDVCPTAELAHSLAACAAIAEYRRAAAAVGALRRDESTPIAAMLRACAWCLECVERTLGRMGACPFFFHPVTVFALVEHGADTLLYMRAVMRRVGLAAHADLAGPVLPALEHAFALCRTHHGARGIPADLRAREQAISEKLCRTLENHV